MGLLARVKDLQQRQTDAGDRSHSGLLRRARQIIEQRELESEGLEEVEFDENSSADLSDYDTDPDQGFLPDALSGTGSFDDPGELETSDDFAPEAEFEPITPHDETNEDGSDFKANPVLMLPSILAGIRSVERGMDSPYLAFGILRDLLGIAAGMIVLPDHADDTLVPFSFNKYDYDTIHRFAVDSSSLKSLNCDGLVSSEAEVDAWKKYFSLRESEMVDKLYVIPCGLPEDGLLVITDSPVLELPEAQLILLQAAIGNALGKMLQFTRQAMLENIKPLFLISQSEFPEYLHNSIHNKNSLVLALPKIQLTSALSSASPGAISLRIERDCLRVFGSIVQDEGAVSMDEQYFYLLFSDVTGLDTQLILEQLEYSLQQAFASQLPGLDFHVFSQQELVDLGKKFTVA